MKYDKATVEECIRVAKGCMYFSKVYGIDREVEVFERGVESVVNSLEEFLAEDFQSDEEEGMLFRGGV